MIYFNVMGFIHGINCMESGMKNETRIKVPKKDQDRIKEIYHDDDGYWVNLNKG